MNRGVRPGLIATTWRTYKPTMVTVNSNSDGSGLTQPFLDTYDGRYQFGRYMVLRGVVFVQIQIQLVGASTVGAGTAYAIKLPIPLSRPTPGQAWTQCIGNGMCYWSGSEPFVNVPCAAIPADPWASLQGSEDDYIHLVVPEGLAWGTFSGNGAQSANHGLGFTPEASSVYLTPSSATGQPSNSYLPPAVTTSSTQITVTPFAAAGSWNAGYKVVAEPPSGQGGNYVGPQMPFDWSRFTQFGPYGNIFITATYEPK